MTRAELTERLARALCRHCGGPNESEEWKCYLDDIEPILAELDALGLVIVPSTAWQRISPREPIGPDQVLLSDGTGVWIGHQAWGEDGFEWQTNDESAWDLIPTHWARLPEPPK